MKCPFASYFVSSEPLKAAAEQCFVPFCTGKGAGRRSDGDVLFRAKNIALVHVRAIDGGTCGFLMSQV